MVWYGIACGVYRTFLVRAYNAHLRALFDGKSGILNTRSVDCLEGEGGGTTTTATQGARVWQWSHHVGAATHAYSYSHCIQGCPSEGEHYVIMQG
jgi:hypothetical protein